MKTDTVSILQRAAYAKIIKVGFINKNNRHKLFNQLRELLNVTKKRVNKFTKLYKVDRKAEEITHFEKMDSLSVMNGYDNKGSGR